jgi:hypothetical protein
MNSSELHICCLGYHSLHKTYTQTKVGPNVTIDFYGILCTVVHLQRDDSVISGARCQDFIKQTMAII